MDVVNERVQRAATAWKSGKTNIFFQIGCVPQLICFYDINDNLLIFPKRTADKLRKLWENLKTARRNELMTREKRETFRTGGGINEVKVAEDPEMDTFLDSATNIELVSYAKDSDRLFQNSRKKVWNTYVISWNDWAKCEIQVVTSKSI